MAGEIYLSNLSDQFDYQTILQKYQELKFQQVSAIQQKENVIKKQKAAFESFAKLLEDFKKNFEEISSTDIFAKKQVTISDESIADVVITDEKKAYAGNLTFTVQQLAKKDMWLSQSGVASRSDTIASQDGTLTISVGSESIDIDYSASDDIDTIATKINQASDKVQATIFFDGNNYRLIVSSKETGTDNALSFSDSGDLLDNLQLGDSYTDSHVQSAQNAKIDILGQTVESQNNTFSNILDGIEITVKKISSDPIEIMVADDKESAQKSMETLFNAYNSLVDYIKTSTNKDGALSGDFTLQSIRSAIFNTFTPFMEKGLLSVDHTNGHISLQLDRFNELYDNDKEALTQSIEDVKNRLQPYLESIFDTQGTINQKEKAYDRAIDRYEDRIETVVKRINLETEMLKKQFIHLDSLLAELKDVKLRIAALLPKQNQQ